MRIAPTRRALLLALPALAALPAAADPAMLVTEAEIASLRGAGSGPRLRRIQVDAPRISVLSPEANAACPAPVSFRVRFAAGGGAAINPESFRVYYGFFGLDITDRVRRHARVDAAGAVAEALAIPSGEHRLLLSIADSFGRVGQHELRFAVA
jgi:hypothetical protein